MGVNQATSSATTPFRVAGVDRESGMDTDMVIHAATAANAKVKAELKGMVVTQVTPEATPPPSIACGSSKAFHDHAAFRAGQALAKATGPVSRERQRLVVVCLVIVMIAGFCVISGMLFPDGTSPPNQSSIPPGFSGWDGSHVELVKHVKARMHNPSSFEHVQTKLGDYDSYYYVVMKYRGTNGFGGVVTQTVNAEVSKSTGTLLKVDGRSP